MCERAQSPSCLGDICEEHFKKVHPAEKNGILQALGYQSSTKVEYRQNVVEEAQKLYVKMESDIKNNYKGGTGFLGLVRSQALKQMEGISKNLPKQQQFYFNMFRNEAAKMNFSYNFYGWNMTNIKQVTMQGSRFSMSNAPIYVIYAGVSVEFFKR